MLLAGFAGAALAQNTNDPPRPTGGKSDWEIQQEEREWTEGPVALPAYPKREDLLEFQVSAASRFRFYVDSASLSVGKDGVVRYTLVARSPAGAENVTREGIRCKAGTYRIYAYGRSDGRWTERITDWRAIEPKSVQRWHHALWREYFCPQRVPIYDVAEGLDALRRGGHPHAGHN
jgi:hypothetical protein